MNRRSPLVPTVLVLVAVGVMIWLGFWQLDRLAEKEALLERYQAAQGSQVELSWAEVRRVPDLALYRRSSLRCMRVLARTGIAGRSAAGEAGIGQYAQCLLADGSQAKVVMGWARDPKRSGDWQGGEVHGTVAPGPRLVADPPLGGLAASARPDPSEIPNNHLAYAVQWFLFAATALIVYVVALRRRMGG